MNKEVTSILTTLRLMHTPYPSEGLHFLPIRIFWFRSRNGSSDSKLEPFKRTHRSLTNDRLAFPSAKHELPLHTTKSRDLRLGSGSSTYSFGFHVFRNQGIRDIPAPWNPQFSKCQNPDDLRSTVHFQPRYFAISQFGVLGDKDLCPRSLESPVAEMTKYLGVQSTTHNNP
jgi:hypothetical protein